MVSLVLISSLIAMSSSSWVILWIFLEMNSLTLCGMMAKELKKQTQMNQPVLLYLVAQISSSIILLISCTSMEKSMTTSTLCVLCLMMKSGSFPFHLWYLKAMEKLKMKMNSMKMAMTWQKILPFFILPYFNIKLVIITMALASMTIPIYKMKKNSSMKSILILSSLNNNSWLMISTIMSYMSFSIYFLLYSVTLLITMNFMKDMKMKKFNLKKKMHESVMVIFNLGGIPPSMMFMGKFLIMMILIQSNIPKELLLVMMMMMCYFMYHYLWCTHSLMMNSPQKTQVINMQTHPWISSVIWIMSTMALLMTM
ncbi:NADH dehydrogenase subunit 2 (mitochondrion) [Dermatophagoides farinae]|nr:NADH dehydrogenase subunit 2 [Dermatophagoides farinae]ACV04224.1 NADH dehydrogenase subunit 2 [Dermatophagoides farinae]